jgi:hypothetical protein
MGGNYRFAIIAALQVVNKGSKGVEAHYVAKISATETFRLAVQKTVVS